MTLTFQVIVYSSKETNLPSSYCELPIIKIEESIFLYLSKLFSLLNFFLNNAINYNIKYVMKIYDSIPLSYN